MRSACGMVAYVVLALWPAGIMHPQGLRLPDLYDSAAAHHPKLRQLELLGRQSELRRRNLAGELLPAISIETQAQYQSDVPRVPLALPGATNPPHDTYDARVVLTQRLVDPALNARRAVERAQLAVSQASVRSTLYPTRQQVDEAFFTVLRAQVQADELRASLAALSAQAEMAAARVREGTALPSEELTVRVEVLRRRQLLADTEVQRSAALDVLGRLTGIAADTATRLALPELNEEVRHARDINVRVRLRERPEYQQFARSRELLVQQERARAAQDLPRATAFGRAGYGQPGLNPLNDTFDTYWLVGMQLQWSPWTWGASRRDRQVLAAQREILTSEEQAFTEELQRVATSQFAAIDRLEGAVALDDQIIAAREQIAEESRVRFTEGMITSAEYVERQTQLLTARLARAQHRVELAQARARLLTTLGIEAR